MSIGWTPSEQCSNGWSLCRTEKPLLLSTCDVFELCQRVHAHQVLCAHQGTLGRRSDFRVSTGIQEDRCIRANLVYDCIARYENGIPVKITRITPATFLKAGSATGYSLCIVSKLTAVTFCGDSENLTLRTQLMCPRYKVRSFG